MTHIISHKTTWERPKKLRIGIIGLSVHSAAFTEIVNSEKTNPVFEGCKVVSLYEPPVNRDVEFSDNQISEFKSTIKNQGVRLVDSMDAVLKESDAIMILTNDGRPHLEEILAVLKSGKPVYVDKPLADTFQGVKAIFKASEEYNVPIFTSSALRYGDGFQSDIQNGAIGKVLGGEAYGPAPIQKAHVDLFWDGIHGVELLYTIMGSGCQSVRRVNKEDEDVVFGTWENGRIGTFRGIRKGKIGFGGKAFGSDGIAVMGSFAGYKPLVVEIVKFLRSGVSPIRKEETLELYAFMEAAKRSKESNGQLIVISDILD
ncbi:MAG: Gfo/Idh/MocA family oxidoreductase [Ginsengibacter sp.]